MKHNAVLKKSNLNKALKSLPEWRANPKQTVLSFVKTFDDHIDALVYIARVTVYAQVLNHHPDIQFSYKKVKVSLTTHDVKGISNKDIEFAKKLVELEKGG